MLGIVPSSPVPRPDRFSFSHLLQLIEYRDFHVARPPPPDPDTPPDPSLSTLRSLQSLALLWEFTAEITEGRQVSGMTWNKGCRDMLAVGYGQFEFEKQRGGLIAFWSLKNPQFPEWTISTDQGVTALDFSAASPNLLAGGQLAHLVKRLAELSETHSELRERTCI
jgi:hypothetical protein